MNYTQKKGYRMAGWELGNGIGIIARVQGEGSCKIESCIHKCFKYMNNKIQVYLGLVHIDGSRNNQCLDCLWKGE